MQNEIFRIETEKYEKKNIVFLDKKTIKTKNKKIGKKPNKEKGVTKTPPFLTGVDQKKDQKGSGLDIKKKNSLSFLKQVLN